MGAMNTSTLEYAQIIKEMFKECYFIEDWIIEEKQLMKREKMKQKIQFPKSEFLEKLGEISNFI